ncbi:MAG: MFS transporter [Melioribacteraceae bacterium]|nr:MFS transporter [Melioribacteraceae bacterium]
MPNIAEKLSLKEKIGYAVGDTASNLYFQIVMSFIPIFYTDVFGLPAAAMSVMFLVTRLWDAVNDPIMGMIADRTNTRWGKYRPYLLWVSLPFVIVSVLTFITPEFQETGKIIYAYLTYTLMMMFYTAVNVPYSALMGVMTASNVERTKLSSFRFVAAFAGQLTVQSTILYMVKYFGKGDDATGWQWAVAALGGLAFALFLVVFFTTKERVYPPKEQKADFKQDLKDLFLNKAWIIIGLATVFQLIFIVMRSSSVTYYVKYYIGEQNISLFGSEHQLSIEFLTTVFFTSGSVAGIIGAMLTNRFVKNIDKRIIYGGFLVTSSLMGAAYYIMPVENLFLIYSVNIVLTFFFGIVSVLQWAMYTDTADFGEWKFGRRATGLIMAASLFTLKLGLTLGGALVGWVLATFSFQPNVDQTPDAMEGILLMISIFPAIFGVIGGALMYWYPLTNKKLLEIEAELTARRVKSSEAT